MIIPHTFQYDSLIEEYLSHQIKEMIPKLEIILYKITATKKKKKEERKEKSKPK